METKPETWYNKSSKDGAYYDEKGFWETIKNDIYKRGRTNPQEHFLRDLEQHVDFSFIYEKVENLYSKTGRNSIDPVVIIKMLLIGYIYGISSESKIEQ